MPNAGGGVGEVENAGGGVGSVPNAGGGVGEVENAGGGVGSVPTAGVTNAPNAGVNGDKGDSIVGEGSNTGITSPLGPSVLNVYGSGLGSITSGGGVLILSI